LSSSLLAVCEGGAAYEGDRAVRDRAAGGDGDDEPRSSLSSSGDTPAGRDRPEDTSDTGTVAAAAAAAVVCCCTQSIHPSSRLLMSTVDMLAVCHGGYNYDSISIRLQFDHDRRY